MTQRIDRRTLLKGAAATTAGAAAVASKRSSAFAAPNVIKQTGSDVEFTFWHSFGSPIGDVIAAFAEDFNAQGNGVRINAVQQGANYAELAQTLTLALQDGTAPDLVLESETWWFRFYLADALYPLDDLIAARSYDTADLVQSLFVEGQRQGETYWLPMARSTPIVYYNVDMFEAAGIETFPATWSEFAEIAPSLVGETGGVTIPAYACPTGASALAWQQQGIVWAHGGAYSDPDFTIRIDEPGAVAAGQLYADAVAAGWMIPSETYDQDFSNGLAASCIASTGGLTARIAAAQENGVNVRTAFVPGELPEVDINCCTGGSGLFIVNGIPPERAEAAFSFIEFATTTEMTARWSRETGYMPVRTSAVESEEMRAFFAENPDFKTAVDQLPLTKPQDSARVFIPSGDNLIGEGFADIVINGTPAADALGATAEELRAEAEVVIEQVAAREG